MLRYAENEFLLGTQQADGASLRQHLKIVERQTGKTPEQLVPVSVPAPMLYLWAWFTELDKSRQYNNGRPTTLHYAEIDSWARLHSRQLTRFELETLKAIDHLYMTKVL